MNRIEENWKYIVSVYKHKLAIKKLFNKLITEPNLQAELDMQIKLHDSDELLLYLYLPGPQASAYHKKTVAHHWENNLEKKPLDIVESILDFESSAMTKLSKQQNAYDTIHEFYSNRMSIFEPYLEKYGLNYSYTLEADPMLLRLEPTILQVLAEIDFWRCCDKAHFHAVQQYIKGSM